MLFAMRSGFEHLPWGGTVWYGHIEINFPKGAGLGELVHESELEEVK
jgi:hypothetical protein